MRFKYPRTPHLPWSPGATSDDRILDSTACFDGQEVIVTAKMDGECTTLYRDGLHARSLDSKPHPSQDWVRALHGRIAHSIPYDMRICGENLYAQHAIAYRNLTAYFQVYNVWQGERCLDWDTTVTWAALLDLAVVQVLYRGVWNETAVRACRVESLDGDPCEGYVVRLATEFARDAFATSVAKFVRAAHVQPEADHWRSQPVVPNQLRKGGLSHGDEA